jgi:hypothetical protein
MLKSVVSSLVLSMLGSGQQLTPSEAAAWRVIEPRIGYMTGQQTSGVAVLINDQGYFVAHKSAFNSPGGFAFVRMGTSELVQVSYVTGDEVTQLILLKSEGWKPNPALFAAGTYVGRQERAPQKGSPLIAVLPSGPIRAVLNEADKMGVLPSKRGVTLSEIRVEKPSGNFGGGLVFGMDGRLLGVLGATLDVQRSQPAGAGGGADMKSTTRGTSTAVGGSPPMVFGPGQMTVAYSITSDLLARVIEGFLSPSRKPNLPVVGMFCSDFKGGGAEVTGLTTGGNAEQAGLKIGDIIVKMGDVPINVASDFMRFVLRQEVGATVSVAVRRGNEVLTFDLKVGAGEMFR